LKSSRKVFPIPSVTKPRFKRITKENLPDLEERAKSLGISLKKAEELINVPTFICPEPKPGERRIAPKDRRLTSPREGDHGGEEGQSLVRDDEP
jgi:hypothetical protein